VTSARHKTVVERAPRARALRARLVRLALPATAATLLTASVVGGAVVRAEQPVRATRVAATPVQAQVTLQADPDSVYRADRIAAFSRSAERVTLRQKPKVKDQQFRTAPLNLWPAPREKGKPLAVLKQGGKVAVTGVRKHGFAQILYDGQVRWVNGDFLADKLPKPPADEAAEADASGSPEAAPEAAPAAAGVSTAPCPDGSATEAGLTPSAVTLFRAVCNAFPALSTYGGYDAHGEHSTGRAIDFMVGDSSLGQAVADWARAHAGELDLYDVSWAQHIWTPVRASEGWRPMSDRGSATANHYDHVHIAVN
jgi:hypothetical protein